MIATNFISLANYRIMKNPNLIWNCEIVHEKMLGPCNLALPSVLIPFS